jgi:hypothetical protein
MSLFVSEACSDDGGQRPSKCAAMLFNLPAYLLSWKNFIKPFLDFIQFFLEPFSLDVNAVDISLCFT